MEKPPTRQFCILCLRDVTTPSDLRAGSLGSLYESKQDYSFHNVVKFVNFGPTIGQNSCRTEFGLEKNTWFALSVSLSTWSVWTFFKNHPKILFSNSARRFSIDFLYVSLLNFPENLTVFHFQNMYPHTPILIVPSNYVPIFEDLERVTSTQRYNWEKLCRIFRNSTIVKMIFCSSHITSWCFNLALCSCSEMCCGHLLPLINSNPVG